MSESVRQIRIDAVAVALTAAALTGALLLNLLPALFAGLLVHALVHTLAPRLFGQSADPKRARFLVVILLTVLVIVLATLLVAAATLAATVYLFLQIPKGFFPVQDTGVILGISEAPQTIAFPAMAARQQALSRAIA